MRFIARSIVVGALLLCVLPACSKSKPEAVSGAAASVAASAAGPSAAGADPNLKSCGECESQSACAELMNPCAKFTGEDQKQCEAVKACVARTGCGQGEHTFTSCYCGGLGTAKCLEAPLRGEGAPAGACHDVLLSAYATAKTNTEVLVRYIEPQYPGGAALARLNCLKINCQHECGFDRAAAPAPGRASPY